MEPDERFPATLADLRLAEAERDVGLQLTALEQHIDRIIDNCRLGGFPVLNALLTYSRKREELEQVAEGLKRIAAHIEQLDNLKARWAVLEVARREPHFIRWAFQDLDQDVQTLLTEMQKNGPSDNPRKD